MTYNIFPNPANQNKSPETEKPKRRKHRDWSGAIIGLLVGMAGMFAARLGHIWIGFDIFAQFWMQFTFLTLACALGLLVPRYKTLIAMVLLTLFVAGYSVWPYYVSAGQMPPLSAPLENEKILRVASFNTFAKNLDFKATAEAVLRLDADVIALIEFEGTKQPVLDELRQAYPYQETCWAITPDCDFAILSKTPLSDVSAKALWVGAPFMSAKLGSEFGNVTIIATHTNRFPHQRSQLTQILGLIKYIETMQGKIILVGDFNATPFSRITQTVSDSLGFERLTYLPSWSATYGLPQLAIDHVFVSPGIRALDHERIGDNAGSDHFPITITLGVPTK